ncbi:MAG: PspC domain-containing protein [Tessaracoccus sp.]|uniref:PspC domain-containing protein n=1 Tax=Tessaracoccus sp. TaxID=1971211 RepID=UPI001EC6C4DF|nr:PspC domain-containing protein [Tessaracoccus sp.]MBK7821717.1 PspC domain-containing protein [Tessaracoccus sp.]
MSLTRSRNGMIAGVASGIARSLNVDPTIVRIAFALLAVFGGGGVLIYVILWLVIPRESDGGTIAEEGFNKARQWYDDKKNGPHGDSF